jgi:predicted nucleic acid-binding protein
MANWVADASPIIILARLGHASLLSQIPDRLTIPSVVAREVAAGPVDDPGRVWVETEARRSVVDTPDMPGVVNAWDLGRGESAVLALSRGQRDCEAVLDDHAARRCAEALGVRFLGSVGVILRAKRRGLIAAAAPLLQALPHHGFHIAQSLLDEALRIAGES